MNAKGLFIVFAFALFAASTMPTFAQSDPISDNVVINEVDINPPGDDSKTVSEWVELYNPTSFEIDIGGWEIASTTILKKTMTIPEGTTIKAGQFKTFSYAKVWFTDANEIVQLRDSDGLIVDQTRTVTDLNNDFLSWQRIYDGYDTDSSSDWKFVTSNAGSSNGKLAMQEESSSIILTLSTDKTEYLFGETVTISGSVSEQVFIEKPTFGADTIKITINGPNYYNKITMYPDYFLKYKTTINMQKNLGINEGIYDVSVEYGGVIQTTQFSVGNEIISIEEKQDSEFFVSFDKDEYIPGQTALISGKTTEVIPFTGLKFKVHNPDGKQIFDGTLYPNTSGEFSTNIYMTTVSPVYGEHIITAEYGTMIAESSFNLKQKLIQSEPIMVKSDKEVYTIGETVIISGSVNKWTPTLDLVLKQNTVRNPDGSLHNPIKTEDNIATPNLSETLGSVKIDGDNSFYYEYKIPFNAGRYGDYSLKLTKDIGSQIIYFSVVEDPESFKFYTDPVTIFTDKDTYDIGERFVLTGKINIENSKSNHRIPIFTITIIDEDGSKIISSSKPTNTANILDKNTVYSYSAFPDPGGNFAITDLLYDLWYDPGIYHVHAISQDKKYEAFTSFEIFDPLNIEGDFHLDINKEIFGLNEKVVIDGIFPSFPQGSLDVLITKPDGDTDISRASVEKSRFTWSWMTPISEKTQSVFNERSIVHSNFGIYKVEFSKDNKKTTVFFKVSPTPETDSLNLKSLDVTTDKSIYNAGEKLTVLGTAIKRVQGSQGLVVQDRAHISVKTTSFPITEIYDAFVYLDNGGSFKSSFTLPVTLFKEGTYKVEASYQNARANTIFSIDNDFLVTGEGTLGLIADTDKDEYSIGETVHLTGRPNKQVYLDKVEITVVDDSSEKITCGSFICGLPGKTHTIFPSASGTFAFDYKIPDKTSAIGKYEIIVDADFGKTSVLFNATAKPIIVETPIEKTTPRTTEKFNRIPDSSIQISVSPKTQDESQLSPRVITGSLFTPTRDAEAVVNIKLTTLDGTCIIGPDAECFVSESTRVPGAIYKVVEIDGINYNIRYSGPDVRLEKFTILPESSDVTIPESTWNVEILKDEQPSRFYYKVTHVVSE